MKPNHKGQAQLFKNPVLERMTRTHIALPISIFLIIATGLLYYGITHSFINVLEALGLFFLGWFIFTLIEYLAHRYIFHMNTDTPVKARLQYTVHGNHHDYPKDKKRLAMPPIISLLYASIFFFVFKLIFGQFVFGVVAGILFGYASYLAVHYIVHAYAPPKNFLKYLWIYHGIHHYKDSETYYGVSSPLWDFILGTTDKKNK
ncbi:sterol desaturase family protein [Pontibacter silvestris]|uniref:Sterol desaturase family protein n=1 Tax=Pontibacter silvestris TaxID=2305183 RepID=A0ABW4WV26_9BACT|nr:sterol desaturase family protein [Pontibacter silvestris]MCC9136504.1 sterol desaturase family protein [Pontibacter silvestris]